MNMLLNWYNLRGVADTRNTSQRIAAHLETSLHNCEKNRNRKCYLLVRWRPVQTALCHLCLVEAGTPALRCRRCRRQRRSAVPAEYQLELTPSRVLSRGPRRMSAYSQSQQRKQFVCATAAIIAVTITRSQSNLAMLASNANSALVLPYTVYFYSNTCPWPTQHSIPPGSVNEDQGPDFQNFLRFS